jgi:hypothetical protein
MKVSTLTSAPFCATCLQPSSAFLSQYVFPTLAQVPAAEWTPRESSNLLKEKKKTQKIKNSVEVSSTMTLSF